MNQSVDHLENCPGCDECDHLLEFYTACDGCGHWMHKDTEYTVVTDESDSDYGKCFCDHCIETQHRCPYTGKTDCSICSGEYCEIHFTNIRFHRPCQCETDQRHGN